MYCSLVCTHAEAQPPAPARARARQRGTLQRGSPKRTVLYRQGRAPARARALSLTVPL